MKKISLRKSQISGLGVYADEFIKKGEICMLWITDCKITTELKYNTEQKKGNKLMIKTGCRLIDNVFLYTDNKPHIENYVNHSFTPNMLYHVGVCFASRDIKPDEELYVDYRYILAKNDCCAFVDSMTGKIVDGIDNKQCIIETSRQLIKLFK